ncbi:ribonuclease HI [Candidatus Gracilibacteria bacterium]|nr:ribonuclease HI [Candidatus Gracilibacteria bacterium]
MRIKIFTDGSCKGNPGPGGWCAIIFFNEEEKARAILSGGEKNTTNNRMEMLAVIEALRHVHENHLQQSGVTLFSDSSLVIKTLNEGWKRKANKDLWEELDSLNEELKVEYVWVRGHNKNKWNEECDRIAQLEADKIARKKFTSEVSQSYFKKGGAKKQQQLFEI